MALSLHIPHDEKNSSTPVQSPRLLCFSRGGFSDRFNSSPRSSPTNNGPTGAGSFRSHSPFRPNSGLGGKAMFQRIQACSPRTPTTPNLKSPAAIRSTLGANWTRAIVDLYQSQEPDEMMDALLEIQSILKLQQHKEHLRFCKKDLEGALNEKRRRMPLLFTPHNREFVLLLLAEFFDQDQVNKLPSAVLVHCLGFLHSSNLGTVAGVCRAWDELASSDAIWKPLYIKRFHFLDPKEAVGMRRFKHLFKERLLDPHVGDLVEVAWKGKFRLESLDIYQGLAWWSAIVVDKSDGSRYKIHYPGWDSRWDEWVHRDRLRWTVEQDLGTRIGPNDDVEIWCCGSNVPGAWLEAKVRKVKGTKYCVGRVLSSGALWVDRDRVRMSPKGARSLGRQNENARSFFSRDTAASVSASCGIM